MSSENLTIFILGVTGYIGGAVALGLKKKFPNAKFYAHTRTTKKESIVNKYGFDPIVGAGVTEEDHAAITIIASQSDIVVNAADCDDVDLTKAILAGLESSEKELPILIHNSGTGLVATESKSTEIWDDNVVDDIKAIPADAPHRSVDLEIFAAAERKKFLPYIIAPGTIYGVAHENHGHKLSFQIPELIREAVHQRKVVYVGDGHNSWPNVHIDDLVDLYLLILDKALEDRASLAFPDTPYENFYWGASGTHTWGDVARAIAPILHSKGLVDSEKATSGGTIEALRHTGATSSCLAEPNRGFKDGWKPTRGPLQDYIKEDVEATLATVHK